MAGDLVAHFCSPQFTLFTQPNLSLEKPRLFWGLLGSLRSLGELLVPLWSLKLKFSPSPVRPSWSIAEQLTSQSQLPHLWPGGELELFVKPIFNATLADVTFWWELLKIDYNFGSEKWHSCGRALNLSRPLRWKHLQRKYNFYLFKNVSWK